MTSTPTPKHTIFPSQYSLHNADNYLDSNDFSSLSVTEILNKYKILAIEYLQFVLENMNCKSFEIYKFLILRGLTTITHVFQLILLNTKNLNLTYFHSQKAFYYYVEFIGQITGEQNTFLQLTSKDAVMFVYKKTIFELHNDYRKLFSHQDENQMYEKHHCLDIYCQIFKTIVTQFINENDLIEMKTTKKYIDILKKIEKNCEYINNNHNNHNNHYSKTNSNHLQKIKLVIDCLYDVKENYHEIIPLFISKFYKNKMENISENKYREKITKFILKNHITCANVDLFIDYITK
jgi:hypothetical protein